MKGKEDDKPSGPVGGRAILWIKSKDSDKDPIKELDLDKYLPIFVEGLREKQEPQMFMANKGLEEIIDGTSTKKLLKQIRGIIYPLKDNLRTLDDDICIKTLNIIQRIIRKNDKLAESFVPHFHLILPNIDILRNRHAAFGRVVARPKSSIAARGGGAYHQSD